MPADELDAEIAAGVAFWGYEDGGELLGRHGHPARRRRRPDPPRLRPARAPGPRHRRRAARAPARPADAAAARRHLGRRRLGDPLLRAPRLRAGLAGGRRGCCGRTGRSPSGRSRPRSCWPGDAFHAGRTAAAPARRWCCLHGFTDTWRTWELVLPALERRHDVLALTLAGHAGGPPIDGRGRRGRRSPTRSSARWTTAGFETAHIVGNSLGGYVALQLAARGRARSVVALAPPAAGRRATTRTGTRSATSATMQELVAGRRAARRRDRSPRRRAGAARPSSSPRTTSTSRPSCSPTDARRGGLRRRRRR